MGGYNRLETKKETGRILNEMAQEEFDGLEELHQMEYNLGLDAAQDGVDHNTLSWHDKMRDDGTPGKFPESVEHKGVSMDTTDLDLFHDTQDDLWHELWFGE